MEPIHIKLNTDETIESRKQILSTEINLLNIVKNLQQYKKLRSLELRSKSLLKTELRKIIQELRDLKKGLPRAKIPEKEVMPARTKTGLEKELREIREELKKLS